MPPSTGMTAPVRYLALALTFVARAGFSLPCATDWSSTTNGSKPFRRTLFGYLRFQPLLAAIL